jgi:hypothetical protein
MDSVFLAALCATYSLFRLQLQLPFDCINFFEKKGQRLLSGSIFGFKMSLFLLFKFGNSSKVSHVLVFLVVVVTPHTGRLRIIRRLSYATGNLFLVIYWY